MKDKILVGGYYSIIRNFKIKVEFSKSERRLLRLLGIRQMMIAELTDKFYKDLERPLYPVTTVRNLIRSIIKKSEYYKFNETIKGIGSGRKGRKVWVGKR